MENQIKALEQKLEAKISAQGEQIKDRGEQIRTLKDNMNKFMETVMRHQNRDDNQSMLEGRTTTAPGNSSISRNLIYNPKLEFPKFDGFEVENWIRNCEKYFDLFKISEYQKVDMASLHVIGRAKEWTTSYLFNKRFLNWHHFVVDLLGRFRYETCVDVCETNILLEVASESAMKPDMITDSVGVHVNDVHQVFEEITDPLLRNEIDEYIGTDDVDGTTNEADVGKGEEIDLEKLEHVLPLLQSGDIKEELQVKAVELGKAQTCPADFIVNVLADKDFDFGDKGEGAVDALGGFLIDSGCVSYPIEVPPDPPDLLSQADCAVLIIDSTTGGFEAGISKDGIPKNLDEVVVPKIDNPKCELLGADGVLGCQTEIQTDNGENLVAEFIGSIHMRAEVLNRNEDNITNINAKLKSNELCFYGKYIEVSILDATDVDSFQKIAIAQNDKLTISNQVINMNHHGQVGTGYASVLDVHPSYITVLIFDPGGSTFAYQTYYESSGHNFVLNASFDEVKASKYDGLVLPGRRASEYFAMGKSVLDLVKVFIASVCHGKLILAATVKNSAGNVAYTYGWRKCTKNSFNSEQKLLGDLNTDNQITNKVSSLFGILQTMKEPVSHVMIDSNASVNVFHDCSVKEWRKVVLEQMDQSFNKEEGGLQYCTRDVLVFHQEGSCTSSIKEAVHFGDSGLWKHTLFRCLVSTEFAELCDLFFGNFHGIKANSVFDLCWINSRINEGAYESSPMLFYSDIQQLWTKLRKIGTEMVTISMSFSEMSRASYHNKFHMHGTNERAEGEQTEVLCHKATACRQCEEKVKDVRAVRKSTKLLVLNLFKKLPMKAGPVQSAGQRGLFHIMSLISYHFSFLIIWGVFHLSSLLYLRP